MQDLVSQSPRRSPRERGFTVVEVMVALIILFVIMLGLALVMMSSYRALRSTRMQQQATALSTKAVEGARDLSYDEIAMVDSDVTSDPYLTAVCPGLSGTAFFDPDGAGPLKCEAVASVPSGGAINPHVTTETAEGETFTTRRYVTWADGAVQGGTAKSYKRFVVVVEWAVGGTTKRHRVSTLLSQGRKGTPAPNFELSPPVWTQTSEPGTRVAFAHSIRNLGVADTYDLTMPSPPGRSWAITFYQDVDQDEQYTVGVDRRLVDTNGNGLVDTGAVAGGETFFFLAVWTLSPSEPGGREDLTLTATSSADRSVSKTATDTLIVESPNIILYLHNRPSPPVGNTTAQKDMSMTIDAPTATTLYRYSTNYYSGSPGRLVEKKNTNQNETSTKYMANWVWQLPKDTPYAGYPRTDLWVAQKDLKCDKTLRLSAYLRVKRSATTNTGLTFASAKATSPAPGGTGPCDFRRLTFDFPYVSGTGPKNIWVELKVTVDDATGDAVLFAYDTTGFVSTMSFPQAGT